FENRQSQIVNRKSFYRLPKKMEMKYIKVANDPSAATTYVLAAHFNASFAPACSCGVTIFLVSNQTNARLLASNSTGRVMNAKAVVIAKSTIPTPKIQVPKAEPVAKRISPAIITKLESLLETLTAGTMVERNFNQL